MVPWGVDDSDADQVHSVLSNRGAGIKVAFIDTGVDCTHPDLASRIIGGFDFVSGTASYCSYYDGHGTRVAGILAAASNGSGVVGMAPDASLYSLRVCDGSGCLSSRIAQAYQWARQNGMQVVSVSLANCGADPDSAVASQIAQAIGSGVIVVASAGNGTASQCSPGSPVSGTARLPGTIAVSAMLQDFTTPAGYQYGPEVDLAAPTDVITTTLGGGTTVFGGTSAATPHVAGAAALLLKQGFSSSQVTGRLTSEAHDRGTAGKDNYFGYGSLDALAAARPRPRISGVVPCYTPPLYAGNCTLTPVIVDGFAPFLLKWEVTYSNGSHAPINTGFISASTISVPVPDGSYDITVKTTPKENGLRQRTGTTDIRVYPVCPSGPQLVLDAATGPTPNAICPPQDPQ